MKAGNETAVEKMALKMALFDCKVMELLKKPEIYNYYEWVVCL